MHQYSRRLLVQARRRAPVPRAHEKRGKAISTPGRVSTWRLRPSLSREPRDRTQVMHALLLDANLKQVVAAARFLGRAGLTVGVAECRTATGDKMSPPAFWSRWPVAGSLLPQFDDDPDAYALGVLELVKDWQPEVVVPSSDQSLASLRPWRSIIEGHSSLAMASETALSIAVDKEKTLELAAEVGIPCPRTVVVGDVAEVRAAMAETGYPAVVKPTSSWLREHGGDRFVPVTVVNEREALSAVEALQSLGITALVQEWSGGRREAVSLFRAHGQVVAEFAQFAPRTTPVMGGASVVRQSIPMPEDLRAAALSLVDAMDLDGYSEVEFRRDSEDRPLIMEVNPRLSGSVELALRCGIDFSTMLWQWASGRRVEGAKAYKTGVRLRWLTGDGKWLRETLRNPGRPDTLSAPRALCTFFGDFARRSAYDHIDRHDMLPAVVELGRIASKLGNMAGTRSRNSSEASGALSPEIS